MINMNDVYMTTFFIFDITYQSVVSQVPLNCHILIAQVLFREDPTYDVKLNLRYFAGRHLLVIGNQVLKRSHMSQI